MYRDGHQSVPSAYHGDAPWTDKYKSFTTSDCLLKAGDTLLPPRRPNTFQTDHGRGPSYFMPTIPLPSNHEDGDYVTVDDHIQQDSRNPVKLHVGGAGAQGHHRYGAYGADISSRVEPRLRNMISQRVRVRWQTGICSITAFISACKAAILSPRS